MSQVYVMLVYQSGIANVIQVQHLSLLNDARQGSKRILQGDFRECEAYCRGVRDMGALVVACGCNKKGDIINEDWEADFGPFRESCAKDFITCS